MGTIHIGHGLGMRPRLVMAFEALGNSGKQECTGKMGGAEKWTHLSSKEVLMFWTCSSCRFCDVFLSHFWFIPISLV